MNPALQHGAFSWSELMTGDPAAAVDFYKNVFPWEHKVMPMPQGDYHLLTIPSQPVAGIMQLPAEGLPTAWMYYVTVDDVDKTLEKATSLGATVAWEAIDVPSVGRMAGFTDPQGAYINVIAYEPMESSQGGPDYTDSFVTAGKFSWYGLQTPDVEAAKTFYAEVFGWTYRVDEMGMGPYTSILVDGVGMGGITPPMQEGIPPHWASYVTVDDCDAVAGKVGPSGGTLIAPPFDIPTVGRNAVIQDPTGGLLNVIKYVPMEQTA